PALTAYTSKYTTARKRPPPTAPRRSCPTSMRTSRRRFASWPRYWEKQSPARRGPGDAATPRSRQLENEPRPRRSGSPRRLPRGSTVASAVGSATAADSLDPVELAVFPPFVYLDDVRAAVAGSGLAYGGQDMYHQANGAFTGEISAAMLVDLGCRYVILGHSE